MPSDDPDVDDFDDKVSHAIGNALRDARNSLGLTRSALVALLKRTMPVTTLACYEQGVRPCPIPRLVEICQALNVSPAELLTRALREAGIDVPESASGTPTIVITVTARLNQAKKGSGEHAIVPCVGRTGP